jgi:hypothetical protein
VVRLPRLRSPAVREGGASRCPLANPA